MSETRGVLLMAYGGPDSLEDVEPFLRDIRGGRETPPELVDEIRGRYAAIGGASPLLSITRAQARALEEYLQATRRPGEPRYRTYVGMRHWTPWIRDAVAEMVEDGIDEVVALCLAPHYSKMSIGAYLARLTEAQEALRVSLEVTPVKSWGDHPLFLEAVADAVVEGLGRFAAGEAVELILTAHSLPVRIIEQGDPYDEQLRATASAVADRVGERIGGELSWRFCYQSAGASSIPWLGPALEDVVQELAEGGAKHLLVAPIGFVSDHVEVLFDLDIEAKEIAAEAGAQLERTASMNTRETFVRALAAVVRGAERDPQVS